MAGDSTERTDFLGRPLKAPVRVALAQLRIALEASWDAHTAYQAVQREGNPAYGQRYSTSRVVQWFFPECEIAAGDVATGEGVEAHFWCVRQVEGEIEQIDLTWDQFPRGSVVRKMKVLARDTLNDSPPTIARCQLLLERVLAKLASTNAPASG